MFDFILWCIDDWLIVFANWFIVWWYIVLLKNWICIAMMIDELFDFIVSLIDKADLIDYLALDTNR